MPTCTRVLLSIALIASLAACATAGESPGGDGGSGYSPDPGNAPPPPPPRQPDYTGDASSLNIGNRGRDGGAVSKDGGSRPGEVDASRPPPVDASDPPDASTPDDASPPPPPVDASPPPPPPVDSGVVAPPDACPNPLSPGDLAIVELMIESASGAGDSGEWIEIQSTQTGCSVNLNGLHVAVTSSGATVDITQDTWLPANGIFVIADSTDPSVDHQIPAPMVLSWSGASADVLEDSGDTVTLTANGATVAATTYPAFVLYIGVSVSFPSDCAWSDLASWARWSYSANVWTSGFEGTPNADNTDVTCY